LKKEKNKMKKIAMLLAMAAMFVGASYSAQKSATFSGDIMDSACAKGGAHNPSMGTSAQCTLACVKAGSKFVLYDGATKTVYQLDDQKKPVAFAGAKVTVTGTLDDATKTIHVTSIKAAA
jgi:type 1 fimbria pilin